MGFNTIDNVNVGLVFCALASALVFIAGAAMIWKGNATLTKVAYELIPLGIIGTGASVGGVYLINSENGRRLLAWALNSIMGKRGNAEKTN